MGNFRFGRRKGGVSNMVLALFSACVLIGFCLVLTIKTPDFFGLDIFQPNTNFGSAEQVDSEQLEDPLEVSDPEPSPSEEIDLNITSVDVAIQELESLGCIVSVVERLEGFSDETGMLLTYPEFKKIATKEEIVFLYTIQRQSMLIIPYEGTFIIWHPENPDAIEEYSQFERVEIKTGYATAVAGGWDVTMTLKNSGSADATITHVFINDVPVTALAAAAVVAGEIGADVPATGLALTAGKAGTVMIYISSTYGRLSAGTTINVKLHSAGGMDYIKLVKLI